MTEHAIEDLVLYDAPFWPPELMGGREADRRGLEGLGQDAWELHVGQGGLKPGDPMPRGFAPSFRRGLHQYATPRAAYDAFSPRRVGHGGLKPASSYCTGFGPVAKRGLGQDGLGPPDLEPTGFGPAPGRGIGYWGTWDRGLGPGEADRGVMAFADVGDEVALLESMERAFGLGAALPEPVVPQPAPSNWPPGCTAIYSVAIPPCMLLRDDRAKSVCFASAYAAGVSCRAAYCGSHRTSSYCRDPESGSGSGSGTPSGEKSFLEEHGTTIAIAGGVGVLALLLLVMR